MLVLRLRPLLVAASLLLPTQGTTATSQAQTATPSARDEFLLDEAPPPKPEARAPHSALAAFLQTAVAFGKDLIVPVSTGIDYRPVAPLALRAAVAIWAYPGLAAGGLLGASGLLGRSDHKLELGCDYTNFRDELRFLSPLAGYRYQPERGGTFVRLTAQLVIPTPIGRHDPLYPSLAASIGFTQ